jgi:hypothetical protein
MSKKVRIKKDITLPIDVAEWAEERNGEEVSKK